MRWVRVVSLALLAGCRIHFDAIGDDDAATDAGGDTTSASSVSFGERPTSTHQGVTIDTYIDQTLPTRNFGVTEDLSLGANPMNLERILVRFDLSALPPGTPIAAAHLELGRIDVGDEQPGIVRVVSLAEMWTQGTGDNVPGAASWSDRVSGTVWTSAGGTLGSALAQNQQPTFPWRVELDTTIVQGWIDAPSTNAGLMLGPATETSGGTHYHFHSRESVVADQRPELVVDIAP